MCITINKLNFDICGSRATLNNFLPNRDTLDEYKYEEMFNDLIDLKKYSIFLDFDKIPYTKNNETPHYNLNHIAINDIILLEYIPYSQKYIDFYCEQKIGGVVFFVDIQNNNALLYYDTYVESANEYIRMICSLEREYCSFYGDTRGYDYIIHKM
jgi:hypothetical protein